MQKERKVPTVLGSTQEFDRAIEIHVSIAVHLNNVDFIPLRAMRYGIEQEDDHVSKGLNLLTFV